MVVGGEKNPQNMSKQPHFNISYWLQWLANSSFCEACRRRHFWLQCRNLSGLPCCEFASCQLQQFPENREKKTTEENSRQKPIKTLFCYLTANITSYAYNWLCRAKRSSLVNWPNLNPANYSIWLINYGAIGAKTITITEQWRTLETVAAHILNIEIYRWRYQWVKSKSTQIVNKQCRWRSLQVVL